MLPKGSLKTTPDLLLNNITYGTDGNGSSLSSVTDGTYTVTINDGVSPFVIGDNTNFHYSYK